MISLDVLVRNLEDGLNANANGIVFKIKGDGGDYTPPARVGNDVTYFVNGVVSIAGSSVFPVRGLQVASQQARLELVFSLSDYEEELSNEAIISMMKGVLNEYFEKAKTQVMEDDKGQKYMVGISYTLVDTGSIAQRVGVGESMTFVIYIDYAFVENGINSYNCAIKLNGEDIPYTTANLTRAPIVDNNPYTEDASVLNILNNTSFGIELQVPAVIPIGSALSRAVLDYIMQGGVQVYNLELDIAGFNMSVPVQMGQCSASLEGVTNATYSISFLQTNKEV